MRLSILRKEIRYRAGGLLALPVLAIAGGWGVYALARTQHFVNHESIMSSSFAGKVTLICAAVGIGCGLWQVLPETRPGSWAFLRHRPVSATRLFLGKLGAALLIYLLVVGVPLAGVIWWAATPGNFFGPWLWQMAVPSGVDLLCGTVYVLAGMLISLREARWFGSRLLPVGLAVACSVVTVAAPGPGMALVGIAVGWLLLLPAAWSATASRGREARQGWAVRTLTAMCLIPAMIGIPAMAGVLAAELLRPRRPIDYSQRYFSLVGAELYEATFASIGYRRLVDEKGVLLKDGPYDAERSGTSADLISDWRAAGYASVLENRPYRSAASYLIEQRSSNRTVSVKGERWIYLRDQRYLVGYELRPEGKAQLIGYIGAKGFAKDSARVRPFEADEGRGLWSGELNLIVEPGRVIQVDVQRRECATIFTTPPGERAVTTCELRESQPSAVKKGSLYAVATDKATYVIDEHQKLLLRRAHLGARYPIVSVGVSADLKTFGLLYSQEVRWQSEAPQVFMRVSADGDVLTRTEVPAIPQPRSEGSTLDTVATGVYLPPVLNMIDVIRYYPQQKLHTSLWLLFLPPAICAAVAAAIAFWLLRRAGERRAWTIFWLITVLLLGISGVLLMLAMRQWPPRVRCGHCGRKSVTTAFACQHCGTAFPIPDPGAIGIWDEPAPALVAPARVT